MPAVHVGQTVLTPQERMAQHERHEKSSRHVRGHVVRLRRDLFEQCNQLLTRTEAEAEEARGSPITSVPRRTTSIRNDRGLLPCPDAAPLMTHGLLDSASC